MGDALGTDLDLTLTAAYTSGELETPRDIPGHLLLVGVGFDGWSACHARGRIWVAGA